MGKSLVSCFFLRHSVVIKYGDSVGNTVAENSSIECAGCYQQGHAGSNTCTNIILEVPANAG